MCIVRSKQKVIRSWKQSSCTGNHTQYVSVTRGRDGSAVVFFYIKQSCRWKRDRPNECSISQEDVRLPPTSYIHSSTLLFHLFPLLEFVFCLLGKQYVPDRLKEQNKTACVKEQADHRHGCPFCCWYILSHLLFLPHCSPVVNREPCSLHLYGRFFHVWECVGVCRCCWVKYQSVVVWELNCWSLCESVSDSVLALQSEWVYVCV